MRPHRTPKQLLIEANAEIEELSINAATDDDTTLTRGQCSDLANLLEALAEHVERDAEPVAWLHTMHMEFDQTSKRVVLDEEEQPFGEPGRDHSEGYLVTVNPLYATPGAAKAAAKKEQGDGN